MLSFDTINNRLLFSESGVLNIGVINSRILFSENDVLNIDIVNNRTVRVMCLTVM